MKKEFEVKRFGYQMTIKRLTFPRFTATAVFDGKNLDIDNIELIDKTLDPLILAKAMRETVDYLIENECRNGSKK